MRIRDLAYETASALDANRGRSMLTILGIVIGISAVIAMTALIGGIKQSMVSQLGLNQARMVYMSVWNDRGVKLDDVEKVMALMPQYEYYSATTFGYADVKGRDKSGKEKTFGANINGVQGDFFTVMGYKPMEGSFFTADDIASGALVVVLDQGAVKQLYGQPDASAVGNTVKLNNTEFRIVGVVDSEQSYMDGGGNFYMPFSTCAKRISGSDEISDIRALAREGSDMALVSEQTDSTLRDYFGIAPESEDEEGTISESSGYVYVMTMQSVIDSLNSTVASFQVMITAVASISLLVGGIGIMNMMLTNVTERIREIGLRKALGARAGDITKQFLLESICLCMVGGVIGIALGLGGAYLLGQFASGLVSEMGGMETSAAVTPVIDIQSVALVTGICVLIGIVFGYYPARRAAKLDPVESLHYQ